MNFVCLYDISKLLDRVDDLPKMVILIHMLSLGPENTDRIREDYVQSDSSVMPVVCRKLVLYGAPTVYE